MPQLTGFDVPKAGKGVARYFARWSTPYRPNLKNRDCLTVDLVVMIDLIFELWWNLLKTPLTNNVVNVSEVFNAECHARIMAKVKPTDWFLFSMKIAVPAAVDRGIFATNYT